MTGTPAALLERAAAHLENLARLATKGTWTALDLTGRGRGGEWRIECVQEQEGGTASGWLADLMDMPLRTRGGDARWMATMSPDRLAPLVPLLRLAAEDYKRREHLPKLGDPNPHGVPYDATGAFGPTYWTLALDLARLILDDSKDGTPA